MNEAILLIGLPAIIICLVASVPDFKSINDSIMELDLTNQVNMAFNHKMNVQVFQIIRLIFVLILSSLAYLTTKSNKIIWLIMVAFISYKGLYIYLLFVSNARYKQINQIMPYYMKMVISLCCCQPVNNALDRSIAYCDTFLKKDIEKLVNDIDKSPNSYQPYQNFIDAHQGRIKNLDLYYKSLYRIAISGSEAADKMLMSLNKSISEDINLVRKEKNKVTNDLIGYIGMLPVALLVVVLSIAFIYSINFI